MANLGPTNIEGNLIIKNQTCTPNMSSGGTSSRVVVLDDDGILRYKTNLADVNHNHDTTYLGLTATASNSDKLDGKHASDFATSNHNHDSITGYASGIEGGTISDLNAIWSTTKNNGAYVYRFSSGALNIPPGVVDNANWVMNIYSHGSGGTASYGHQLSGGDGGDIYFRVVINGSFGPWKKLWNTGNFDPATKADTNHNHNTAYLGITATATDSDKLDGKHASDFATSTHNHDGIYSTTDTKNTAGATNTSSKIYLVGSTEQTANPQTYTHDTAYVDIDGNVYSGNSKTITNSDLLTNQIVTPTLNPT